MLHRFFQKQKVSLMHVRSLLALLITTSLLLAARPSPAETITLVADEWCPYTCAESGYMIEIARDIFQKNNIKVEYSVMSWADAVGKTREGGFDAVVGATQDDVPDFIFPEATQGLSDMRFWVREDSAWVYSGLPSLEGIRLGVVQDYAYTPTLNAYIKQHASDTQRLSIVSGNVPLEENLRKLQSGEVNVIAEDDGVINYYLTMQSQECRIKSVGTPVSPAERSSNYLYIAFSPKNPKASKYAAMLDAGMKELRASGELDKILELYRVRDWYGISKK
jgi:polar amino acid transport system substrate-binding protein